MVNRQIDVMAELQNAFSVLFKNWVLAIPTAVVYLITAVLFFFVLAGAFAPLMAMSMGGAAMNQNPGAALGALAAAGPAFAFFFIVFILLVLLAQAIVIGGAEHVWHGEPPDLAHGVGKAMSKLPQLIILFLIAAVISVVCGVLVLALGLGVLLAIVLFFFFMYTLPAIVVGNEGAIQAMGTSARLVRANFGPSVMAFLAIFVVNLIAGFILQIFTHMLPLLAVVANLVIGGLTSAFAALVIVRFYDLLRASTPQVAP